ncbi:sodium/potassium-transporting atpase subunit alpha [Anaeramoeba flamelloides]|uniref:Sodium/potassium-transporting atpase subunit alpha n=1 Tax=Anaeramoeba flamelloides TaxID=1746091 RepID=A0AAV7ZLN4_9EUKA|nr:sodium/potassium-transporting atpase subunit alpha [Anaeramoeba flamelloides]
MSKLLNNSSSQDDELSYLYANDTPTSEDNNNSSSAEIELKNLNSSSDDLEFLIQSGGDIDDFDEYSKNTSKSKNIKKKKKKNLVMNGSEEIKEVYPFNSVIQRMTPPLLSRSSIGNESESQNSSNSPLFQRTRSWEVAHKYQETRQKINRLNQLRMKNKSLDPEIQDDLERLKIDEHTLDLDVLVRRLNTDLEKGLTEESAIEKLEFLGPNILTQPKRRTKIITFLRQFFGGFSILLLLGSMLGGLGYILGPKEKDNLYVSIVLLFVVVITSVFSYTQQKKHEAILDDFKQFVPEFALVIRDGEQKQIVPSRVVVGDILLLKAGEKISADIRIISPNNFKVDNSSLTGESVAQIRSEMCTSKNPLETDNLAFCSATVAEGRSKGIVIRTGDSTLIGHIAKLTVQDKPMSTPINLEIKKFIRMIKYVAIILGFLFFLVGIVIETPWITNLIFCIGIIVANVPEGLLSTVTAGLTLTSKRMAKKCVLVKHLESIETLGSTSVICSDKTGTLTQNQMTVSHLWFNNKCVYCDNGNDNENDNDIELFDNEIQYNESDKTFQTLYDIMALCNNSFFLTNEPLITQRKTDGNASDCALLKFCESIQQVKEFRSKYPKLAEIPFNSNNRYHLSIHSNRHDKKKPLKILMKGSPEEIIKRCSHILIEGERMELDEELIQNFNDANNKFGSMAERVLAFCTLELDPKKYSPDHIFNTHDPEFPLEEGYTLVGIISMIDPPKPGVREAVENCHTAGIKIIMVTGDQSITAKSIAEDVGILTPGNIEKDRAIVVTGSQLHDMLQKDLDEIITYDEIVFSRTTPQQKLIIVEACQRVGHITAVTGDGTNDAPALKKADIGIAMGIGGSDVAKGAANIILLDDNFASIVNGVEEGRLIFDNLKKSIAYTLTSNIPEITPFLTFITFGIPLPLTIVMILCIDLGTDLWPAISLAYETAETDIMKRLPRNQKTDRLVSKKMISFTYFQIGIIQALAGFLCYFVIFMDYGIRPGQLFGINKDWENQSLILFGMDYEKRMEALRTAQTGFFISIIIVQWADLIISKTRRLSLFQQGLKKNKILLLGIVFETIFVIIICYVPYIHDVLKTESIKIRYWAISIPFFILIFVFDETRKFLLRKYPNGWVERFTQY